MNESAYLCSHCLREWPGPAELAEHIAAAHAPPTAEPFLELARRIGMAGPDSQAQELLEPVAVEEELGRRRELDGFLEQLRREAAEAIRDLNRGRLSELKCELEAIARAADFARVFQARIGRVARESAELLERVLQTFPENPQ